MLNPLGSAEVVERHYRMDVLSASSILSEAFDEKRLFNALEGVARLWAHLGEADRQTSAVIVRRAWITDPGRTADVTGHYGLVDLLSSVLRSNSRPSGARDSPKSE